MTYRTLTSALALGVWLAQAALPTAAHAAAPTEAASAQASQRPNVLVWMLDDVGFAQLSPFGGLVDTPNVDRVARLGLRYSNYHTPPICSASRAAFLTGRNPHSIHMGGHAAITRPEPGYDALLPASAGTVAENLHQAGYQTFALGKWDHVPVDDLSGAGSYDRWPLGQGFDKYYGFLSAEADNWSPGLTQDNTPITTPTGPDYHLHEDLSRQAIRMIHGRAAHYPATPFFMYWATGAAHAPHHAPAEWIARYKGRFDQGWDVARQQILRRQIAEGLLPAGAKLAPRPDGMPAWKSLTPDQQRLYARQMEVFAAALSHADAEFGRILDALEASGELDNTIVVITSDNGASAEGAPAGAVNEHSFVNGEVGTDAENMPFIDRWGGPETYPHYALGWAVAGNTPFRYYKQTVHEGGSRVPLVIAWPKGVAARGEIRDQFAYVTDLAPTILAAANAPLAEMVNNVRQTPMEGRSLVATFESAEPIDRDRSQYVELYGNKGLWSQGWSIVTTHRTKTWDQTLATPPNEPWELYDLTKDPGQVNDLAKRHPERLAAMAQEFERQAALYNVNPIGNIAEAAPAMRQRMQPDFARRGGRWTFATPVARLSPMLSPPILTSSYRMSAEVTLTEGGESGPIFASGNRHGGVSFYLKAGQPVFMLRSLHGASASIASSQGLPKGTTRLDLTFDRPQAVAMRPADITVTIKADGVVLAKETVRFTLPLMAGEGMDIGSDDGGAVSGDYRAGTPFEGHLRNVVFDFSDQLKAAR